MRPQGPEPRPRFRAAPAPTQFQRLLARGLRASARGPAFALTRLGASAAVAGLFGVVSEASPTYAAGLGRVGLLYTSTFFAGAVQAVWTDCRSMRFQTRPPREKTKWT